MGSTVPDPLQQLLNNLEGVEEQGNGHYVACCPGHDDHDPSLHIKEASDNGSRRVLLHCHAARIRRRCCERWSRGASTDPTSFVRTVKVLTVPAATRPRKCACASLGRTTTKRRTGNSSGTTP